MAKPEDGMLGARRATARDVAARAGVSVGTVSKAFSGRGAVSDATRRRIMDVAAELGYDGGARLGDDGSRPVRWLWCFLLAVGDDWKAGPRR